MPAIRVLPSRGSVALQSPTNGLHVTILELATAAGNALTSSKAVRPTTIKVVRVFIARAPTQLDLRGKVVPIF